MPGDLPEPPEGIQVHRNRRNGFVVARVHYTADPDKRSADWKRNAQAGFPDRKSWNREYEISWDAPAGDPVFPEFDAARMVRRLDVLPGARPLRGWDFGHVCPCVLIGQLDAYGRLMILREIILPGAPLEVLIDAAKAAVLELWGEPRECFDAGDPAGEKMTDLGQVKKILGDHNILLRTMRSTEGSYAALRSRFLAQTVAGKEGPSPKFLVDPVCVTLINALAGALHKGTKPPFKPVESHPHKDVCDALRYVSDNLMAATSDFMTTMSKVAAQDCAW